MRRLALVGASLVLVGGLAACGGSPDDASKDDFCKAMDKVGKAGDDFDKYKDAVDELSDTGTPENIDDDARDGFEFLVDEVGDADSEKDLDDVDVKGDDKKATEAFGKYYAKECQ
ncbi:MULTISPECIES: hypothetical protein [unclassified Nocardioides]|jgi:hypothetical protein|uniref:hypothetical protein n=1 Tax=unclassified Nocardioides TaxID=2615069 RepID=UPI0006F4B5C1|nr:MULTISPECIES: hypothetical protein [unclassified Nocardioides]KQY57512.1 hypothetical protein ASD30_15105 [Nocardioides sp. Root140]KQZ76120.1 hypothetical protein ASD66_07550 [Nocardioides sp. Root151]KRF20290.1 hypothetical protein ASH02_21440 [Nocardioides sp. Soil796]